MEKPVHDRVCTLREQIEPDSAYRDEPPERPPEYEKPEVVELGKLDEMGDEVLGRTTR